jgi:hypothetical protein
MIAGSASPDLRRPLWLALIGVCSLLLLLNLAELKPLEIRLGPGLLAAFLLAAGGMEMRRVEGRNALSTAFGGPPPSPAGGPRRVST